MVTNPSSRLHLWAGLPIWTAGGWWWTIHSPTGSGPEGSSPNEPGTGHSSSLPPHRQDFKPSIDGLAPRAKLDPAAIADLPRPNGAQQADERSRHRSGREIEQRVSRAGAQISPGR